MTGSDGFIGSHLAERLVKEGFDVKAFCQYNSFSSRGWLDEKDSLASEMQVILGDIRDPYAVKVAMKGVDIVFHLAALIAIPYSYHSPQSYLDTNVTGTLNVLQAARELSVPRILVTSTSEVYGTARQVPIDESHSRQAQSPYSATKIAADALSESFYRSFGLPVTVVRPFNTYGPRQSARAVIPTIITQLLSGFELIRLGDLKPSRDLVYVADTVEGFLRIARTDELIGEEVNIATGVEVSVGELANELIRQISPNSKIVTDDKRLRPSNSEVFRLVGSVQKLKESVGWSPNISLREGLTETIRWFRVPEKLNRYKADIYNI